MCPISIYTNFFDRLGPKDHKEPALAMIHGRVIEETYLLTNELTSFLYSPNKGGINAKFASHSIGLSVLTFSTISYELMPTTIPF